MFDRRLIQYFDWGLAAITIALIISGLSTVYSATRADQLNPQNLIFFRQMIWYGVGFGVMIICFLFSYRRLDQYAYGCYWTCILLLIAVLFFGKYVAGSRRWLTLGPISIQPSELMKLGIIILLSRYYSRIASIDGLILRDLLIPSLMVAAPCLMIISQPDLGTAIMILLIAGSMTLFAGIEKKTFLCLMFSATAAFPIVWHFLKGYQKQRILTFLTPDRDPLGAGYHIIQSKIAIGSGQLFGKGFMKGTQNALSFLPEQHTDFIFSVLAEDWGFLGSVGVLLLLLLIVVWGLNIAHGCREPFGLLMAFGISTLIFWEVVINIGMVMGLLPVV
ncbi:MAG TPA: rod shape-determining protein RodA, partial [Desulfatirhabdiaceae bacterium]|nr:rod shape-determining protein RodA [Desulfatirhabdiaceae bacterium]